MIQMLDKCTPPGAAGHRRSERRLQDQHRLLARLALTHVAPAWHAPDVTRQMACTAATPDAQRRCAQGEQARRSLCMDRVAGRCFRRLIDERMDVALHRSFMLLTWEVRVE